MRGFSQVALAERSGVDRVGLNRLEGEFRGATLSTIEKLAQALAVDPWELLKNPVGESGGGERRRKRAPLRSRTKSRLEPKYGQRRS